MTAEQIREWAAHGIEFGAHSRTHPDLTALSQAALVEEVAGSGQDLAGIVGTRVVSFAYPYGFHNEPVLNCVRGAFDLAFGTDEGLNDIATDPYLLLRTMVQPTDSWMDLRWRVRLGWNPLQRLRTRIARARGRLGTVER